MNKRYIIFYIMLGLLSAAVSGRAAVTGVWAVGDGEKVYRYESGHPGRQGNLTWDGLAIELRGLYNEVLAFQVIVEADSLGAPLLIDSHSAPVADPVWALYERFAARLPQPVPTLIERDQQIPPLASLVAEATRAGRAQARAQLARAHRPATEPIGAAA